MNGIKNIYTKFNQEINFAYSLIKQSQELYENNKIKYNKDLHYKIVEACFMDIYNSWEDFIEKSFILYLLGDVDFKNNKYKSCINPKDEEHAYNIIRGIRTYPKWTDLEELMVFANLYFINNGPFDCLKYNPIELREIKNIRNFISHKSEKSKKCFKNVLIRNTVYTQKIKPGEFLMMFIYKQKITFFSYYCEYLKILVDKICNI